MKRWMALFLFLLLWIQVAGIYLFFVARLAQVHEESRDRLKEKPLEELERLELTETEYEEARVNDREVKLNGKMYDIGRMQREPGKVILYAEHDVAEDDLLAFVEAIWNNLQQDQKPMPSFVTHMFTVIYLLPYPLKIVERSGEWMTPYPCPAKQYSSYILIKAGPPPRVVSIL
jgi:hypothetical protein